LNHLNDITLHPRYSRMLGFTQEEIEYYFSYYISKWENQTGEDRQVLFEKLKDFYNGYSWDGVHFVYNPFSILSFFDSFRFDNYWFASGSPTFLINILKTSPGFIDQYNRFETDTDFFDKYDIDALNISSLLFQTGYLTIKERKEQVFTLSYPNREVRTAFFKHLLEGFSNKTNEERNQITRNIKNTLSENNIDEFITQIKTLLSSIPYNIQIKNREAYYHSLIYVALQLSMLDVGAEIQTAFGRSDIVVSMEHYIYIIEFKLGTAQSALDQIDAKEYYASYLGKNKKVILLGIGLDEAKRNIGDWESKEAGVKARKSKPKKPGKEKPGQKQKPAPRTPKDENETTGREEKHRMANLMLSKNYPIEEIILLTGLSEEEIRNCTPDC
jgi:hypothetical protein